MVSIHFSARAYRIKMHIEWYEVTTCIRIDNCSESVRCIFMTANPLTCQKCGSPVTPEMKFCESCGAKIEILPVCPQCGAALVPNIKFCENCGASVSPAAVPVKTTTAETAPVAGPLPPLPETSPVKEVKSPVKAEEKTLPVPKEKPVPPAPPVKVEEKTVLVPEEKPAPAPAPVKMPPKTEKAKDIPKETGPKKPIPQQTLAIAGILVLALLGAAVYFVVLPMITGPATTSQNQQAPTGTTSPSSSANPVTPAGASQASTVSLTPGPTQVPPSNRVIVLDAERDPITSIVSVTFRGGEGQYGVSQIMVTLTRSDGSSETKSFKPDTIGSGVTFQGTPKTDRLEATSYFYSGEQYKIIDQIFEYKKRTG